MQMITETSEVKFEKTDNGYVLTIPAGAEIKEAITLTLEDENKVNLEINIGANARATVLEDFSGDLDALDYTVTVNAEQDANIKLITLQNFAESTAYTENRTSQAEQGADVHFINFQFGAKTVETNMIQNGNGVSPTLNTDFISSAKNEQQIACTVKNHFHQKNGGGEINAKGVAKDKSNLEINGIIAIDQPAGGTNTFMHEHALLLSKEASVKATPALEIDTNDVKASHGASISNLSDEALFYAKSRGLEEDEARKIMAKGFLADRLEIIDDLPELKERVESLI